MWKIIKTQLEEGVKPVNHGCGFHIEVARNVV